MSWMKEVGRMLRGAVRFDSGALFRAFAEARLQPRPARRDHDDQRQHDLAPGIAALGRTAPGRHHPVREPEQPEHAGPERRLRAAAQYRDQRQQRRQREHQQRGDAMAVVVEPHREQHRQGEQGRRQHDAGRRARHASFAAMPATRRPSARASTTSSSLGCGSSCMPETWLAPYGVPPPRVVLSAGSVYGNADDHAAVVEQGQSSSTAASTPARRAWSRSR